MDYIKVGHLNKSFGTKGQIKVVPDKTFESDLENCDVWFIENHGEQVPYFVEKIDSTPHFLVKFEDVDNPESAKQITGGTILLRSKDISFSQEVPETEMDKLIGFAMVSSKGDSYGDIKRIEEFPQQLIAFVGPDEVMIPLNPVFILDIDTEVKKIVVDLPEGLVEAQS